MQSKKVKLFNNFIALLAIVIFCITTLAPLIPVRAEGLTIPVSVTGTYVSAEANASIHAEYNSAVFWQVYIPAIESWVDIAGENDNELLITPAKFLSLLNYSSGSIYIRARDSEDNYSDECEIYIDNSSDDYYQSVPLRSRNLFSTSPSAPLQNSSDTKAGDGDEALTYNVAVNFTFVNGELVADPFFTTIEAGDDFNESIAIPELSGYTAYLDSEEISGYLDINISDIDRNYTYNIIYHPAEVTFVVEHYLQNAENDDYSFYMSETLTGYTMEQVGNVAGDFTGFYPLLYNHVPIAADGSTVVQIYYDRYYYLMEFQLDGGTGVDPIYARYGMPVSVNTPRKNGYTFEGWDVDPPATVPLGGGTYVANWSPSTTKYNVLFWYENTTGIDKYSVAGSEELNGTTGDVVDSSDYRNDSFTDRDDDHFVYNPDKTETVTLNGAGTSIVNVYFDRIEITFNFYDEALASSESGQRNTNLYYTMTGRWGSTFDQNGVSWPSEKAWSFWRHDGNSSSMGMSFMDAFLPTSSMGSDTTVNFYTRTVSGNTIYFLKEKTDGTYATDVSFDTAYLDTAADDKVSIATNSSFTFSEKYEGFTIKDYQNSGTNYNWVYTKNGQTYTYTGKRYEVTTNTADSPQYGLVDGEIVELEYATPKIWYLPYIYTPTDSASGTLYGIVESEYTRLNERASWIYDGDQTYTGNYVYRETDAATSGVNYYGVVNGSVVPVSYVQGYFYGDNNSSQYNSTYKYKPADPISEGSGTTYYYLNNGSMSSAYMYYHDGAFYRTRTTRYEYIYTPSTSTRAGNYYIPNSSSEDGYTEVYLYRSGNRWYLTYDYTYTQTTGTSGNQYGYYDGEYVRVYYNNGRWYRTREWSLFGGYEYSDEYDGPRYTRSNSRTYQDEYTGTKYTRSQTAAGYDYSNPEDAYTRSNTSTYDESTQYYGLVNGQLVPLTALTEFRYNNEPYTDPHYTRQNTPNTSTGTVTYYGFVDGQMKLLSYESGFYDEWGNVYNGQRYTRANNSSSNAYTGTRYVRTNNSMPYSYKRIETNSGTQYGLDSNMGHQRLSSTTNTGAFYYNGERYNGTRYIETNASSGNIYGFVDGTMYSLSRGSSYTGFGDTWQTAVVGGTTSGAYNSIIRYERKSYKLEFYNHSYFLDDDAENVKYEYSLADYDFIPEYPYSLPYGMYEFVGWYDNQECLGEPFDFEHEVMPANNVTLYAKYEPVTLTVNVYKDLISMTNEVNQISTERVPYGNLATVPDVPENENYTFVGWFYQNRYGEEMPFQFSSMEVTQNLNIYGKWTSEVLVPYTVNYETDTGITIAESITNSALAASTKTFTAKTDRQLYPDYRTHWFPLVPSHSLLMQEDYPNEYTFVYVYREFVPYTVRYVNSETGEELLPSKTIEDNAFLTVTERYQPIAGYVPDAFKKSLTLSIDGTNEIIFYYSEDDVRAPYVINYYVETENGYELYNYRNETGIIGSVVTAPEITINGYVFNPDAPGTTVSGVIADDGLELNLYYDRITYPYKVRYLERSTNRVLAPETTGRGYFEEALSFDAIDIDGYDLISPETQSLTIGIEEGEDPRNNVVTFYYRVQQAEFNYVAVGPGSVDPIREFVSILGTAHGSTPTADDDAEFAGWFKDAACTIPVTSEDGEIDATGHFVPAKVNGRNVSATYYAKFVINSHSITIDKTVSGNMGSRDKEFEFVLTVLNTTAQNITYTKGESTGSTLLDGAGQYTFTLAHGETIVFSGVPHGCTYTITETEANTNGYITTVTGDAANGILEDDISVSYENRRNMAIPTDIYDKNISLFAVLLIIFMTAVFAGINGMRHRCRKEK